MLSLTRCRLSQPAHHLMLIALAHSLRTTCQPLAWQLLTNLDAGWKCWKVVYVPVQRQKGRSQREYSRNRQTCCLHSTPMPMLAWKNQPVCRRRAHDCSHAQREREMYLRRVEQWSLPHQTPLVALQFGLVQPVPLVSLYPRLPPC